ncbi:FHF complex subunit HOOK interacting protein 2A-like isoform X2 [Oratosquilla oratoria]|uniref:FHF complex subunit HOOK interacting protein 2A-like isoform X2 n=1 Tax=Oratosquilla oratoria TaxID=337810 RepID=UPI003F77280C
MSCSGIFGFVASDLLCQSIKARKKKTDMLSRLNSALQAAADVVLVAEENLRIAGGPLSPCLEFVVQGKVLPTLVRYAHADRPLGIRQHVYVFLTCVLNHLHHSHLHQASIHKPIQAMVCASNEMKASPYESEEMEFLSTLCEKIQQDNTIIILYIQPYAEESDACSGYTSDSCPPTPTQPVTRKESIPSNQKEVPQDIPCEAKVPRDDMEKTQSKFPLIDSLLNLCYSADTRISESAHDCLLSLIRVRERRSSAVICQHTLLPQYIATRLYSALDQVPSETEPALVEDVPLSTQQRRDRGTDGDSDSEEDYGDFPGKRELVSLLHWLVYCDKVLGACDSLLGSSICSTIREVFLEGALQSGLTNEDEETVSLYIAICTKIVSTISAPRLINCVVSWLSEDTEELDGSIPLRQHLLNRCTMPPHHLQIQALRLFQVMLEKPGGVAVQALVLSYVTARGYYDSSVAEHQQGSWSDEEDERYKHRGDVESSPGKSPVSRTLAPANISKIVKRFLSIIPEEAKSTVGDDYDSYVADAQRQYKDCCRVSVSYGWPREALCPECPSDSSSTASRESKAEAELNTYSPGPLLSVLMDFLEHLCQQDYEVNLQVTSLISSLALLPHPHLHEFLLNPLIPLVPGTRTPYQVLSSVVSKVLNHVTLANDYGERLRITRHQLLGTMEEFEFERDDDDRMFEALIVIEEFCKELAAIAHVKFMMEHGWM